MDQIEQPKDYYDSKTDTTETAGISFIGIAILAFIALLLAIA